MVLPEVYHKYKMKGAPKARNAVFIYGAYMLKFLRKKIKISSVKIYPSPNVKTYIANGRSLLVVILPIGAPATAATIEELHLLGIKKFYIFGAAGSLTPLVMPGSLVLCTKAVRDEGTSHHYAKPSLFAYPGKSEVKRVARVMRTHGIRFYAGPTWTIDAPYRETVKEVEHYRRIGVLTVEMEAAALFVVAKKVGASACAVFAISDLLDKKWSGFVDHRGNYKTFAEIINLLFPYRANISHVRGLPAKGSRN